MKTKPATWAAILKLNILAGQWWESSSQEAEAGGFQWVWDLPGDLQSEFQDSQGYTKKPCLEKNKTNKQTTKQNKQTKKEMLTWKGAS